MMQKMLYYEEEMERIKEEITEQPMDFKANPHSEAGLMGNI
jgi:hypothetical protein